MHRFTLLVPFFFLIGCRAIEDLPPDAVALSPFPQGIPFAMRPGDLGSVAVQALNADGKGANGVAVVFLRTDPRAVVFSGHDLGEDSARATSAEQTILGVTAPGLATAGITIPPDAPLGPTIVHAVLFSAAADAGSTVARLTIEISARGTDASLPDDSRPDGLTTDDGSAGGDR